MTNFLRWLAFGIAALLIAFIVIFATLFLSRLYGELSSPAFLLLVLVTYSASVALAAINYATKLENRSQQKAAAQGDGERTARF